MKMSTGSQGHEALTDAQTDLPNKLHWDTVFGVVYAAGARGIPLTLILMEINHYQEWLLRQDAAGAERVFHLLGDALGNTVRQSDLAARTQEERFAFLLLDCNLAGGRLVVDRLDGLLEPVRRMTEMSFSMGVAAYRREMTRPEDLVGAAEEALRRAQARGGDQMEFHGD